MKFRKEEKPFIKFVCTIPGFETIEEIQPKPAKKFLPDWWKDLPTFYENTYTAKVCPSMGDYFSSGYVLPMWADASLICSKEDNSWRIQTSGYPFKKPGIHDGNQLINHTDVSFGGKESDMIFKLHSPWQIITSPGYSVMQLPMFYNFNKDFTVLPGIIDTDIYHEINNQLLYHGNGKEILIKRGTPLCVYIPFKRTDYEFSFNAQTKKEENKFKVLRYDLNSKFQGSNWYRSLQRKRDK